MPIRSPLCRTNSGTRDCLCVSEATCYNRSVTLTRCSDLSAAAWLTGGSEPPDQMINFGPAAFSAYARLRFLPDPTYEGQGENDVDGEYPLERPQLSAALEVPTAHTRTPEDCYFCLWEGFLPQDHDPGADWKAFHGRTTPKPSRQGTRSSRRRGCTNQWSSCRTAPTCCSAAPCGIWATCRSTALPISDQLSAHASRSQPLTAPGAVECCRRPGR